MKERDGDRWSKREREQIEGEEKRKRKKERQRQRQMLITIYSGRCGSRCYVQLDVLQQFKTDLVRRLEGLVFEEKKFLT
jgi:hypothetical protein